MVDNVYTKQYNKSVIIEWDEDKNRELKRQRGISFELAEEAIESGRILDDVEHTGEQYRHQRILIVEIAGYPVMVPYVQGGDKLFLKTMFRNRKLKGLYDG